MVETELLDRLYAAFKKGDKKAYEELFHVFYKPLVKYSFQYLQMLQVAEEIVQDVFISLWQRKESVVIQTSIKSYLFRAVKNRTINYIKLQLPKDQVKTDLVDQVSTYQPEDLDNSANTLHQMISSGISELPPKCRTIFLLSRNEGLTHKEIAEELNISTKTVENQITIAIKRLKEKLAPVMKK